jgi:hypothetical protein
MSKTQQGVQEHIDLVIFFNLSVHKILISVLNRRSHRVLQRNSMWCPLWNISLFQYTLFNRPIFGD